MHCPPSKGICEEISTNHAWESQGVPVCERDMQVPRKHRTVLQFALLKKVVLIICIYTDFNESIVRSGEIQSTGDGYKRESLSLQVRSAMQE